MIALKGVKETLRVRCQAEVMQDNGRKVVVPFYAVWQRLDVDAATEVFRKLQTDEMTDREICDLYLVDIQELKGEGETEAFAFDVDLVDGLMAVREYKRTLMDSFVESTTGRKNLTAKN